MPQPFPTLVLDQALRVALLAGELVANRMRARPGLRLLLPTGHTPLHMYETLRGHAADGSLPAERATLFQLDEYVGLGAEDARSYQAYLRRELRGIRFGVWHALDGAAADPHAECRRYQLLLDEAPIDLAVLGLGRDGHVAFDEPGSSPISMTRSVALDERTRADAAGDFGGLANVPTRALTVGMGTLRRARELMLLVSGAAKAEALRRALEGTVDAGCPASLLRDHSRITVVCDTEAASLLQPQARWSSDQVVIVLGHREPGVSPEQRISDESLARLRHAEGLVDPGRPRAVILTGYTRVARGLSEAEQMQARWSAREVPALLEDAGRNTAENASRSLPIVRALGGIRRVTVVTSAWHLRTPYFFAPYRAFGLRLSFSPAVLHRGWLRMLPTELGGLRSMRSQRRAAMAALRLAPEPGAVAAGDPGQAQ